MQHDIGTPHAKYLKWADAPVGFKGQDVLEIGGCSPVAQIQPRAPKSWTCFNLDPSAVAAFNRTAQQMGCTTFRALEQDAATIDGAAKFSIVYSINAFEHIRDLATTLGKIRQVLVPGGKLFTVFGPIWSCDVGHHLSIPTDDGPIGIFDGVLKPWEHLTSTPEQIYARIEARLGTKTAKRVIEYVFNYPDLNRLSEADHMALLHSSGLTAVLVIRRKAPQQAPAGGVASRTRELLWVAKNGRPSLAEKASAALGFSFGFASTRLRRL
jgi:SAM-dependent methyltransferase